MKIGGKSNKSGRITKKIALVRQKIVLWVLIIAGFGTSVAWLARAMIFKADDFRAMAESQQLRDTAIPAERGVIYDRNMTVLAQSVTFWDIMLCPSVLKNFPDEAKAEVEEALTSILEISSEDFKKQAEKDNYEVALLKGSVTKEVRDKVLEFMDKYYEEFNSKGEVEKRYRYKRVVRIDDTVERVYPYKTFAAQILGFTGADNNGLEGIENMFNSILTGIDGRRIAVSAASSASDIGDIDYQSIYEPVSGDSIVLTIDETIQRYLESALEDCYKSSDCSTCYGIVQETKTGKILGMATVPGYDPSSPFEVYDEEATQKAYEDELAKIKRKHGVKKDETYEFTEEELNTAMSTAKHTQWKNRAIMDVYDPGSVFKVITLAAGLEEGIVSVDNGFTDTQGNFTCSGSVKVLDTVYHCHNRSGCGSETLAQGLMNSCNPYFITIGQKLGVEKFYKYFEAFGFTEKTGFDISNETAPSAGNTYFKEENMTLVNLASCSFGQSFQTTAIQMLNAINAVANGGKLMTPYIVEKTIDSNGKITQATEPVVKRQVISESTSKDILSIMEQVATEGTAKRSYVPGYRVAGKTGTSTVLNGNDGDYIASFAGCAPANDPEISIIIVVDRPRGSITGGAVAAPVAAEVIEKTLEYLNVERQYTEAEKEKLDCEVPNVVSMSVSDARSTAYGEDFKVRVVGDGDTVVSQMPIYGQYMQKGGVIVLYTEKNAEKETAIVPDFAGMTVSQANYAAVSAGVNIKFKGNLLKKNELTTYKQTIEPEKVVEAGSTVQVYFGATSGLDDR